jgi:asparagine synthase (glutamine-hydrolysing)
MCGIAGIVGSTDHPAVVDDRLLSMRAALRHRGPDDQGLWRDDRCGLAHTRLSIIDLEHGHQPMLDASGRYVVVFNGEIYNHLDLRTELRDSYPFSTTSDTETILAAYAAWGDACVDRLNGMFAFFLWDRERQRGFAARDALGVKPLVYRVRGSELVLASEAKAILAQEPSPPPLHLPALIEGFVVPGFSGVRTSMFEGIDHLAAGHQLVFSDGGIEISPWFRHRLASNKDEVGDADALALRLRAVFDDSVRRTLLADVPIGSFLSGGLDSTAITSVATRHYGELMMSFSIRFEDHASIDFSGSPIVVADDAPYAEEVAELLGLQLERVTVDQQRILTLLDRLAEVDDRLLVWEQEYVQYVLAEAAAAARKVVLVGDTADETHYGYFWFLDPEVTKSPRGLMNLFGAELRASCLSRELREEYRPLETLAEAYEELAGKAGYAYTTLSECVRATTYVVLVLWLGRLLHNGDIHTMAHSLEARVPFSDRELLALAETVAPKVGFAGGEEKALLRKALRPFVPDSVFDRKKSALPRDPRTGPLYQVALRTALEEEAEFAKGFFDVDRLLELSAAPQISDIERTVLFSALALLRWQRRYGGGVPTAPAAAVASPGS